jgi:hypothetical protein
MNKKACINGGALILAAITIIHITNGGEPLEPSSATPPSLRGKSEIFLSERHDYRYILHGDPLKLKTCETNGVFLFLRYGRFEDAILVPTNECPNAEAAFQKFDMRRRPDQRQPQIRIVQRDAILQTPMWRGGSSDSTVNAVLTTPLNAGDILIVTRKGF